MRQAEQRGEPTLYNLIRADIDAAITVKSVLAKTLFEEIKRKFLSRGLKNIKQIIDAYVHKIVVHPETVTVYFNFFPKITIAYAQKKIEGCENSQPSGSLYQRNLTNVDRIGIGLRKDAT